MISIAYVNNRHDQLLMTDPFISCESAIEKIVNDSDEYIENFIDKYNQFTVESAIMGDIDDTFIVTESQNVFERIGEAIIAIFNKFKELVKKIAENLSSLGFKNKSDLEKMDAMVKKHPELSKEIVAKFDSGELAISDAKNLKEIEAAYDEILKAAKNSEIDPKSFKGKVEAFKKKLKEADKSAVIKGVGAAATIITAGTAILTFRKNLKEVQKENDEEVLRLNKMSDKTLETFKAMDIPDKNGHRRTDDLDKDAGKAGVLEQLYKEMTVASIAKTKKNNNAITRMSDAIHSFLLKHDKDGKLAAKDQAKTDARRQEADDFISAMRTAVSTKDRAAKKATKSQASQTKSAQNKADMDYYNKHEDAVLDRKYNEARATRQGQQSVRNNRNDEDGED